MKKSFITIIIVFFCILFTIGGCTSTKGEGFAIYLTKDDVPPAQMEVLSHIDIAEQPIISMDDIVIYNAQTHELKLTANAFERVSQLEVPVIGKSFVVCVDREPIYWGAFWTPISSISFDGVTIWKPFSSQEPHIITFELGYPSPSFYGGEDPRNSLEVIRALQQAGKLVSKLSITTIDELPHSMKGYELYSWTEDSQWYFTLITGTDRNKTLEEITSSGDIISEAGWVKIHVVGVDAIKAVLSKFAQGEEILWLAGPRSDQTPSNSINFMLPPESSVDSIKEHALTSGLDFQIVAPS